MSLFGAMSISASGMTAQRARAQVVTENMANADTTRTPEGGPYRRKDLVFESTAMPQTFGEIFSQYGTQASGVSVSDVITDSRDPERRYLPGHADAGPDGYVAFPRINPAEEMVDLMSASRSYQANVAAVSSLKDMISKSIDLFR